MHRVRWVNSVTGIALASLALLYLSKEASKTFEIFHIWSIESMLNIDTNFWKIRQESVF